MNERISEQRGTHAEVAPKAEPPASKGLPAPISGKPRQLSAAHKRPDRSALQLIYRPKGYEGDSKDYEFSRRSMEEHWRAGYGDAVYALRHPEIFERSSSRYETLVTFDFSRDLGT